MRTGREVALVVGVKRRNQRLRSGSTVMSEDLTPLMGLGVGGELKSRREKIRRLRVPLVRRTASVTADAAEMERRVLHGRAGTESDELLLMLPGGGVS